MLNKIRLLIFDLDYIIFDCAALKSRVLRQSLLPFADHIPPSLRLPDPIDIENGFRELGTRWIHSLEIGLDEGQLAELEREYRSQERHFVEMGRGNLFPQVREFLAGCRMGGLILALGAEAHRDYLLSVSDRCGMDQFFHFELCTEEYGMGRADEMFLEIMNRGEVLPSETLVLGTRPSYFRAGHNVDLLSIGCGWGLLQPGELNSADFQSPSIGHLLPLILQADALSGSFTG